MFFFFYANSGTLTVTGRTDIRFHCQAQYSVVIVIIIISFCFFFFFFSVSGITRACENKNNASIRLSLSLRLYFSGFQDQASSIHHPSTWAFWPTIWFHEPLAWRCRKERVLRMHEGVDDVWWHSFGPKSGKLMLHAEAPFKTGSCSDSSFRL